MYVGMYHFQALEVISRLETLFTEMEENKLEHGSLEKADHFDLEFKHVSFRYEEQYVCRDLSFYWKKKDLCFGRFFRRRKVDNCKTSFRLL